LVERLTGVVRRERMAPALVPDTVPLHPEAGHRGIVRVPRDVAYARFPAEVEPDAPRHSEERLVRAHIGDSRGAILLGGPRRREPREYGFWGTPSRRDGIRAQLLGRGNVRPQVAPQGPLLGLGGNGHRGTWIYQRGERATAAHGGAVS